MKRTCLSIVLCLGLVSAISGGSTGKILFEHYWTNGQSTLDALFSTPSFPNWPDRIEWQTSLEGRIDWRDSYGTRVRGYLIPPQDGDYTFWIASDDQSQLRLSTDANPANALQIASVAGWTPSRDFDNLGGGLGGIQQMSSPRPMKAGTKYYFEVFQIEGGGGDNLAVAWQGPGIPTREIIQGQYLMPFGGLKGEYFPNMTLSGNPGRTRIDPEINFSWDQGEVFPGTSDLCSIRWSGQVEAPSSEPYTFYVATDDGARLWVDGKLVIDAWWDQAIAEYASAAIPLEAGRPYKIRLEWYDNTWNASCQLRWSSPSTPKQIIPSDRLGATTMDSVAPGLVGWWMFDEGFGTTAYDNSGNGHHGILAGNPTWAAGHTGGGLAFDGVDDDVRCGSNSSLNITDEVTVSVWIKLTAVDLDQKIAGNQGGTGGGYKFGVFANNRLEFEIRTASGMPVLNRDLAGGTILLVGVWYHVAGVYSASGQYIRTFVNGQLDRELITKEAMGLSAGTFEIGHEPFAPLYWWNGLMDDIRVYNRALSATEVAGLAGPSLVGWWKFDEGSGTTLHDSSGYGHDGVLKGNVTWTQGPVGKALSFSGHWGDYVDIGNWNPSELTGQLTISQWVYWSGTGNAWQGVIGKRDTWNRNDMMWQVELTTNSNPAGYLNFMQEGSYPGYGFILPANQWVHVAMTFDGTNSTFYRDGQAVGTVPFSFGYDTTAAMTIGACEVYGSNPWTGSIDDVRIYNRALSAGEVAQLCTDYGGGGGTPEDPYQIWTPQQMNTIGLKPDDWDKHFTLMADLDMSLYPDMQYPIIGTSFSNPFIGTFEGNGHIIRNLTFTTNNNVDYVGLFGLTDGAIIKNLGVENVCIESGGWFVGGLVGENLGTISSCYVTGSVDGTIAVGGLTGGNWSGSLTDCDAVVSVNGTYYVGGLVGDNFGDLTTCHATGPVSGANDYVGGLAGQNYGIIADCFASGSVSGTGYYVGGLVGENNGSITNCSATGSVRGSSMVGGLVGDQYAGLLNSCYTTGSVISSGSNSGGLVGYQYSGSIIKTCYAMGSVSGYYYVGGLVGQNYGTILFCYSTGQVIGGGNAGGLIASNYSTSVASCFWDIRTSGRTDGVGNQSPDPSGVVGADTATLMARSTFVVMGWDFTEADGDPADWVMPPYDYPKLAWQATYAGRVTSLPGTDMTDFEVLSRYWLSRDCRLECQPADLDHNGIIDESDLLLFIADWMSQ
jgi:hypothetical protein